MHWIPWTITDDDGDVRPRFCSWDDHEFVNVGFTSLKLVCKYCDMDKPEIKDAVKNFHED